MGDFPPCRIRHFIIEIFGYPEGGVYGIEFASLASQAELGILRRFDREEFDELMNLLLLVRQKRNDTVLDSYGESVLEMDNLVCIFVAIFPQKASHYCILP